MPTESVIASFNPRAREERDVVGCSKPWRYSRFNPRAREERDIRN